MLNQIKTAVLMTVTLTLVTGLIYPLFVTFVSQIIFPHQANGSLINYKGQIIGSKLIGQDFTDNRYFHSRPSEINYDASKSGGSNLGPTNKKLIERINSELKKLKLENQQNSVPSDLVTTSASGLDPHISVQAALFQVSRVSKARKISEGKLLELVYKHIEPRQFKVLGEKRVNVLNLNLELEKIVIE